jgi:hypothetical protein
MAAVVTGADQVGKCARPSSAWIRWRWPTPTPRSRNTRPDKDELDIHGFAARDTQRATPRAIRFVILKSVYEKQRNHRPAGSAAGAAISRPRMNVSRRVRVVNGVTRLRGGDVGEPELGDSDLTHSILCTFPVTVIETLRHALQ